METEKNIIFRLIEYLSLSKWDTLIKHIQAHATHENNLQSNILKDIADAMTTIGRMPYHDTQINNNVINNLERIFIFLTKKFDDGRLQYNYGDSLPLGLQIPDRTIWLIQDFKDGGSRYLTRLEMAWQLEKMDYDSEFVKEKLRADWKTTIKTLLATGMASNDKLHLKEERDKALWHMVIKHCREHHSKDLDDLYRGLYRINVSPLKLNIFNGVTDVIAILCQVGTLGTKSSFTTLDKLRFWLYKKYVERKINSNKT